MFVDFDSGAIAPQVKIAGEMVAAPSAAADYRRSDVKNAFRLLRDAQPEGAKGGRVIPAASLIEEWLD